ncbi:MAG: SDR family oxidoreductase [Planctomycetes bacterium]|nr:SDR family oxidoreductase [Planctomycetota bacterium]
MSSSDRTQVERPVQVVLGGAGGIGSALCRELVARGDQVVIAGRNLDAMQVLASELGADHAYCEATDPDAVEALLAQTLRKHGHLDGLANCVGSILVKPIHTTSLEEWEDCILTNLWSAFATVRAAGRVMRRRGGSVVLLSAAAARVGLANHEAIAAAKAGVEGLALSAAATYARDQLRFNCVAPGLVRTPLSDHLTRNPISLAASANLHPMGRIGEPEDVSSAIAWLLAPGRSWVTGQVISIDGGLSRVRSKS